MCSIVLEMHKNVEIERYERMDFIPYNSRTSANPSHEETFNTFPGFPLNDYTPTRQAFTEGWCDSDPEKADYMLYTLCWKANWPFLKTQRANYMRSETQGNGKSTFFAFLKKLFGQKSVLFLLNLGRMHCRFNSWQIGCLWLCTDDIRGPQTVRFNF